MKSAVRVIFVSLIALVMLNIVAFTIPFTRESTFWAAYIFADISVLLTILISVSANSSKKSLRSRFYGWQLISVVAVYLIVQLAASLVSMSIPAIPSWVALTFGTLLLGFCLLGLLAGSSDNSAAERFDIQAAKKIGVLKTLHNDLLSAAESCSDSDLRFHVERLAEAIRFSDPMSSPALAYIENDLSKKCANICAAIDAGEKGQALISCKEATRMLDARNRLCLEMK